MSRKKSMWNKGDEILLNREQNRNEYRLFNYYTTLTLNRFRWKNLPPTIESRHIEQALYSNGQAFFFNHDTLGLICLPCSDCNELNILGDPLGVTVTGHNYSEILSMDKGVRILDNDLKVPPLFHILHYVDLMEKTEQTIILNLEQQRTPYLIPTTKETELSLQTMFNKIDNFNTTIFIDKTLSNQIGSEGGINVFKTDAPYLLDKLQDFKHDIQAEMYSFIGLNNANTDKKERMIVDEVNVNNSEIKMSLDLAYKNRVHACKLINEKFGTNISVEKVVEIIEDEEKEVGENDV